MKFLSLFSGVGGFDLGFERAGMECVGQVEIDGYCREVLARHWPDVWRVEDVRSVNGWPPNESVVGGRDGHTSRRSIGAPDLICGGFPCQDVSVAGKRAGLDGARSGLWFEFQRILSELRPRWAVIENVPGLLSSNQGRDFAVILDGLGECGFGGISWAVLDSQHFGVAQRRRRVFVVCGPSRESVAQVLSLCESCGGHPYPGGEARQGVAATLRGRASRPGVNQPGRGGEDDENLVGYDVAAPLGASTSSFGGHRNDLNHETYIPEVVPQAISAKWAKQSSGPAGDEAANLIAIQDLRGMRDKKQNGIGIDESGGPMYTLDGVSQHGVAIAHTLSGEGADASEDGTGRGTPLVAQPLRSNRWGGSDSHGDEGNAVMSGASVRRLTPTECARLQGFPDDWLHGSDAQKYRALGNAVTVPVAEYLGRRIMAMEEQSMSKRDGA